MISTIFKEERAFIARAAVTHRSLSVVWEYGTSRDELKRADVFAVTIRTD